MGENADIRHAPKRLRAAGLSDPGRIRPGNEDAVAVLPEWGYLLVADGMGGGNAGATASKIVAAVLPKMLEQRLDTSPASGNPSLLASPSGDETLSLLLRDTLVELSQMIWKQSAGQPGLAGMGATVALACVRGRQAFIAHMGDSRAYLLRQGRLERLTQDHTVVGILLRGGEITPEEAKHHPARSRLSRYVGMQGVVYPDVRAVELANGDRLLLCSDGLTGMVEDAEIARILGSCADPEAACRALVDAANAAGGKDNVTVVVADWGAGGSLVP